MKRTLVIIIAIIIVAGVATYFAHFFDLPLDISITKNEETIVVFSPLKDSEITSPLSIIGRARGQWFFEGSFPIVLLDEYRNVIAEGHVAAVDTWMTEEFVPFAGTLQFNNYIKGQKGTLVLNKDNPSGLKKNRGSVEIPIIFK